MLATLAGKLSTNESFNPDRGFQVDVVFVSMPGPGLGRGRKRNPGRRCLYRENRRNDASSPSTTEMTCAVLAPSLPCERIVTKTMAPTGFVKGQPKAWAFGATTTNPGTASSSGGGRGTRWLGRASPISASIGLSIAIAGNDPDETFFFIFKRPAAPYLIRLLKSNHHFDGCSSFPAFVNRSYYCVECERGSTPMIELIIPVKGNVVLRVADLTVGIMCVVPGPRIIVHCVTASFTVPIVNAIML